MGTTNINLGLDLVVPTSGTKNWGALLLASSWNPISAHRHTGSGDGLQMITASYADNSVTTLKLAKNIGNTVFVLNATSPVQSVTVDWDNGNIQTIDTVTSPTSILDIQTLSNGIAGSTYRLIVTQTTGTSFTFNATVKWPQGVSPLFLTTTGEKDIIDLFYDGTDYLAVFTEQFIA